MKHQKTLFFDFRFLQMSTKITEFVKKKRENTQNLILRRKTPTQFRNQDLFPFSRGTYRQECMMFCENTKYFFRKKIDFITKFEMFSL